MTPTIISLTRIDGPTPNVDIRVRIDAPGDAGAPYEYDVRVAEADLHESAVEAGRDAYTAADALVVLGDIPIAARPS